MAEFSSRQTETADDYLNRRIEILRNRLEDDMLADINVYIYSLRGRDLDKTIDELELVKSSGVYENLNRINKNLLGNYSASDFIENPEVNSEEIDFYRKALCVNYLERTIDRIYNEREKSIIRGISKLNMNNTYTLDDSSLQDTSQALLNSSTLASVSQPAIVTNTCRIDTNPVTTNSLSGLRSSTAYVPPKVAELTRADGSIVWIPENVLSTFAITNVEKFKQNPSNNKTTESLSTNPLSSTKINNVSSKQVDFSDTLTFDKPFRPDLPSASRYSSSFSSHSKRHHSTPHTGKATNNHLGSPPRQPMFETRGEGDASESIHNNNNDNILQQTHQLFRKPVDIGETVRKWRISFNGESSSSIDKFIEDVERNARFVNISERELLDSLSILLTGIAANWYISFNKYWHTWEDFCTDARRDFGAGLDFQSRLKANILERRQGEDESIRAYIFGLLAMMEKAYPPISLNEKLNTLHNNMRPDIKKNILRTDFDTIQDLMCMATQLEKAQEEEKLYKPPPPPEHFLFPEMAYKSNKKVCKKSPAVEAVETTNIVNTKELGQVSAIMQEILIAQRELRSGKDARNNQSSESDASSDSEQRYHNRGGRRRRYHRPHNSGSPKNIQSNASTTGRGNSDETPRYQNNNNQQRNNNSSNNNRQQNSNAKSNASRPANSNKSQDKESLQDIECLNCNKKGHYRRDCPQALNLRCYNCQTPGVTQKNCTNCNLNEKRRA